MPDASYEDILLKSLRFSLHPKRWLPFFIVGVLSLLASTSLGVWYVGSVPEDVLAGTADSAQASAFLGSTMAFFLLTAIVMILYSLISIWIYGALVQQSHREGESVKSAFRLSLKRYPRLLLVTVVQFCLIAAVFLAGLAIMFGSSALGPLAGLAGAAIGIIFMAAAMVVVVLSLVFADQSVIIAGNGAVDSLRESYWLFRKRPLYVFAAAVMLAVTFMIISLIFSLPSLIYSLSYSISAAAGLSAGGQMSTLGIMPLLYQNIPVLLLLGAISSVGYSISMSFFAKGTTEFYLAWRKRRLL